MLAADRHRRRADAPARHRRRRSSSAGLQEPGQAEDRRGRRGARPDAEQLADRLVPDFGLDADGSLILDYGPRRFIVGFDEQLKPYVTDAAGKRRKDLPKPGARDDAGARARRPQAVRRAEEGRTRRRRRPDPPAGAGHGDPAPLDRRGVRRLFVGHPLLWHIVRRLVWGRRRRRAGHGVRGSPRTARSPTPTTTTYDAARRRRVGIAHPLDLGDGGGRPGRRCSPTTRSCSRSRSSAGVTADEPSDGEAAAPSIWRAKIPTGKVLGLERRGWRRGEPQDAGSRAGSSGTSPAAGRS